MSRNGQRTPEQIFGIKPEHAAELLEKLTPREKEVAALMAAGWTNSTIAARLDISKKTLDIHRGKVKRGLGCPINGIGRIVFASMFAQE